MVATATPGVYELAREFCTGWRLSVERDDGRAGRGRCWTARDDGTVTTISLNFSSLPESARQPEVERLCEAMEAADRAGRYSRLTVERPWSAHNPVLEGEFAAPAAIRWYLERELGRLAAAGATVSVTPGRPAVDLHDPALLPALDESSSDPRRKKMFLFSPERMALSIDRLYHY
ncbi:MAG: hypothetical protein J2P28_13400, partial [Actinobacteria bacterium]|nr:hypothetical protein [Actinomycetota bacterium]